MTNIKEILEVFLPAVSAATIIMFGIFLNERIYEKWLDGIYTRYSEKTTVKLKRANHSMQTHHGGFLHFSVEIHSDAIKWYQKNQTIHSVNKKALDLMDKEEIEVYSLMGIIEKHKNLVEFARVECGRKSGRRFWKLMQLKDSPMMILECDRDFAKQGNKRRLMTFLKMLLLYAVVFMLYVFYDILGLYIISETTDKAVPIILLAIAATALLAPHSTYRKK